MTYHPTPKEIEREAERLNEEFELGFMGRFALMALTKSILTQRHEAMEKVRQKCAEEAENYDDFVSWTKVSDPESYVQDRNNKIAQAIRSINLKEIE